MKFQPISLDNCTLNAHHKVFQTRKLWVTQWGKRWGVEHMQKSRLPGRLMKVEWLVLQSFHLLFPNYLNS